MTCNFSLSVSLSGDGGASTSGILEEAERRDNGFRRAKKALETVFRLASLFSSVTVESDPNAYTQRVTEATMTTAVWRNVRTSVAMSFHNDSYPAVKLRTSSCT